MKIEKANKADAGILTELTIRSKNHWNYGVEQIKEWRDDLTISETYILEKEVYKLAVENILVGYYSYFGFDKSDVKLDNLFVDPTFIGKGFGDILIKDFIQRIKLLKIERVVLEADPNVEEFYKRIGFKTIGKSETFQIK